MVANLKILGKPVGKQRPKFSRQGAFVKTYTPDKTLVYENFVKMLWIESGQQKLHGAILVEIVANFKIPASVSKKKRELMKGEYYTHKPDADNIAKIVLDPLNGLAFDDDSQVVVLTVSKIYSDTDEEYVELNLTEADYNGD